MQYVPQTELSATCGNCKRRTKLTCKTKFELPCTDDYYYSAPFRGPCGWRGVLWEFPSLIHCPHCGNVLWVEDPVITKRPSSCRSLIVPCQPLLPLFPEKPGHCDSPTGPDSPQENESDVPEADPANSNEFIIPETRFPNINESFNCLESAKAIDKDKELQVRIYIWRRYNDKVCDRHSLPLSDMKLVTGRLQILTDSRWRKNTLRILELAEERLIRKENELDRLLAAEVNRNLGNFETALFHLDKVTDKEYPYYKKAITHLCHQRNRYTAELSEVIGTLVWPCWGWL